MQKNKLNKVIILILVIVLIVMLSLFITSFIKYIKSKKEYDNKMSGNKNSKTEIEYTKKEGNETVISIDDDSSIRVITEYNKNMFKGSKSLIFFWASWCSHCIDEAEVVKNVITNYQNRDYKIYMISHDYEVSTLSEYMKNKDLNYEVWFDEQRVIRHNLDPNADSVPLTYFLDENGTLLYSYDGSISLEKLDELIALYF